MTQLLQLHHVTKKYHKHTAVNDVTVSIPTGKIIGLLGPNGSGKTTIIKMINGLLQPDKGDIVIDGYRPSVETKKIISYLPDTSYLQENMKIKDVVTLFEDFYNDFDSKVAYQLFEDLNLNPRERLKNLSKGNKEKVQLILVMSRKARLYILDEPIGGVDPAARDYILKTIISNYSNDASVLISTHLISDIEPILDEVIFLKEGEAVLLVSIILGLVLKALGGNFSTDTNSTSAQIFTIILVLLLAMVISGSLLSTLAIIIKRFYSNIFGRQGYLTLTLPVTTNQIICSKLLASLLWSIFNIFIVIIGIILVILPLVGIGQFVVAFPEIYKIISSSNAPLFIAYFFLSYVAGTLLIYLSIAVGQLFTNKRVLMGIVSYFGISLLITFLTLIIDSIFHIDLFNSHANATFSQPVLLYNILVSIVEIAIFYMLTHSIIKYKLNIQ